jgi:hypothetical protein
MVQVLLLMLFSEKNDCTYGALKSRNPVTSIKVSFYKGKIRPLIQWLRVDIVNMDCLNTSVSNGATFITHTLLRKK